MNSTRHGPKRWLRFSLAGLLFAVLCWAGLLVGMRLSLERIALTPDPLQLTVVQRSTQAIPGLKGLAVVHLGDITRGQVALSIHDDAQRPIVTEMWLQQGDAIPFHVNGQTFYLHVRRLENHLIGDDRAVFELSGKKHWPAKTLAPNTSASDKETRTKADVKMNSASAL